MERNPDKRLAYKYKPYVNPLNSESFFIDGAKLVDMGNFPIESTYMADEETENSKENIYYNKIRKKDTRVCEYQKFSLATM